MCRIPSGPTVKESFERERGAGGLDERLDRVIYYLRDSSFSCGMIIVLMGQ